MARMERDGRSRAMRLAGTLVLAEGQRERIDRAAQTRMSELVIVRMGQAWVRQRWRGIRAVECT